jgi:hypothetical protein
MLATKDARMGVSSVYGERHVRTGETPILPFLGRCFHAR